MAQGLLSLGTVGKNTLEAERGRVTGPVDFCLTNSVSTTDFLQAAASLKNQIVKATWMVDSKGCNDPTAYAGLLGTAMMCFKSYQVTGDSDDLSLCSDIVDACTIMTSNCTRPVTFLRGNAGVYALGAVVASYRDDVPRRDFFLHLFMQITEDPALPVGPEDGGFGMPYELLHGRAGFLYAALFINKYLGSGTVPASVLDPVVDAVFTGGRAGSSDNMDRPLMYRWHGTRYLGAAQGVAGILHVLLHFKLKMEDQNDVKETIRYLIRSRYGHSGNYPSSEGSKKDLLVQWSHGAGGIALMLCKAAQVFPSELEFRTAAIEAGEVVWNRGLNHKIGLSDGVSGNAYVFLSLYRLTKEQIYVERAKAFSEFLYRNADGLVACNQITNDAECAHSLHSYSLFEGLAGVACLWFDLACPSNACFPGFEI